MTNIERAEVITELYALRSRIGAIHQTVSQFGFGTVAVDVAMAGENITEGISTFEKKNPDAS